MLPGFDDRGYRMNVSETFVAPVTEFAPSKVSGRMIEQHRGSARAHAWLCRTVSGHGLRATELTRVAAPD